MAGTFGVQCLGDSTHKSYAWRVSAAHSTANPGRRNTSVCKWPQAPIGHATEPNAGRADGDQLVVAAPTPTRPDRSMHDSSSVAARPARSEQSPGVGALAGQRLPGAYNGANVSGGLSAHQAAGVGAAGSTTTRLHRNPSTTKADST